MVDPRNHSVVYQFSLGAALALAVMLLAPRPAPAQFWIAPDRSVVIIGRQPPVPLRTSWVVTPVVVGDGRFVRVAGSVSAVVIGPSRGYPGTGLLQPFYPNDRAKAANFAGSTVGNFVGPWQPWW